MKILLWINTLLEGLVGLLFLFYPGVQEFIPGLEGLQGQGVSMLISMYGVAALTLALFSAFLLFRLKYYQAVLADGLLLFTLFHAGLAVTQFVYNADVRPGILHGGLALAFMAYYWKQR